MMKEQIKKLIFKAVKDIGSSDLPMFSVEIPTENKFGDYSTNVALVLAKQVNKNPLEVAKDIAEKISSNVLENIGIEKVEVAGPGFINFYLSKDFFIRNIKEILKNKNFGKNNKLKNQKVIVEYTDPNILKEFHIGH